MDAYIEAVTALEMRTGRPVWAFQPHEPNRDDTDFGATPNLFVDTSGRKVLGVGNKDGRYYALDPATGALLWETKVAEPGNIRRDFAVGGFIGSSAAAGGRVFGGTALGGPPYYHALDGGTGEVAWRGAASPTYAASAVANGVVLAGALDGVLRAWGAATGVQLAAVPLGAPVSSGPVVVGDRVFIGSGTSTDICAKGAPGSRACSQLFEGVLGGTGGVHALRPVVASIRGTRTRSRPPASTAGLDTIGRVTKDVWEAAVTQDMWDREAAEVMVSR